MLGVGGRFVIVFVAGLLFISGCDGLENKLVHRPETLAAVVHATTAPSSATHAATQSLASAFATDPKLGGPPANHHRELRVDVGPPPATLAVWIIDPPRSTTTSSTAPAVQPRGTILV